MAASSQLKYPLKTPFSQRPIEKQEPRFVKPRRLSVIAAHHRLHDRKLRVAVIGGGPAGSFAAEALASGGIETFLFERSPSTAIPCGGVIPLCMIDEFSIPIHLIDRHVTKMKIISPSNLTVDFRSKSLRTYESIPMLRREVLDSFLQTQAESAGARMIPSLVTHLEIPFSSSSPYVIHHTINNSRQTLADDAIIDADEANSKVAKSIKAGNYTCTIAFQERIKLPDDKMEYYQNLVEMYVGNDVSPDFYAQVFTKYDHVAVGTVIKVEAHPIPEHPRPTRVRGRVSLMGDAVGYVIKCSGEGIYFVAKSGRMCGEAIVRESDGRESMISEDDLKREYLMEWDKKYLSTFRFLNLLQRVFYGSDEAREALVEVCGSEYVQRMTFDSYLYKKLAQGDRFEDVKMVLSTLGSLMRCKIIGRDMEALKL
ncbi:Geranylgeranyl diphosphate reductase [Hibiscus syriacus]|uniref:Geranylgeranyl diphosphate reductase n=1 Tax=Hibiscus syriacus TaxID=106335 RepID=A0A6A3D8J6_HIBSY|nr:Geranylgeranyl diphosphate reductase [Hibiscus syriacus]